MGAIVVRPSRWSLGLLAGFAVLFLARGALAGPPFITDDPEPVELHHWEVYIASIGSMNKEGGDRDTFATLPHLEVNYGAIPELQLHVIAPLAIDNSNGSLHYGYGDTELGFKYRFIKESDYIPQVGIFPLVELPTGNANEGLGNGKAQYFFPVWLQKSWGKWTTYGGGGYWLNQGTGSRDWWYFGWLLQRQITDNFLLGGEIYQTTPDSIGAQARTGFNVGAVYDFDEHHHLMGSIGRDFIGRTQLQWYLAFQFTF